MKIADEVKWNSVANQILEERRMNKVSSLWLSLDGFKAGALI